MHARKIVMVKYLGNDTYEHIMYYKVCKYYYTGCLLMNCNILGDSRREMLNLIVLTEIMILILLRTFSLTCHDGLRKLHTLRISANI